VLITRNSADPTGLEPGAVATLLSVADQPSFHTENGFRPAIGIYNLSMYQVWKRFPPVLDALKFVLGAKPYLDTDDNTWLEPLLTHHEALLYSLMEHIEDCQNIVRGYFPKSDKKASKKAVETFTRCIHEYRNYVAPIVNGIKHNQLRLHAVVYYSDNAAVVGYFVLGPDEKGALGPAAAVHGTGGEAYSFAWDLRFHFAQVYLVAHHLTNAICAIRDCGSTTTYSDQPTNAQILTIAERISHLPQWVFPNELGAAFPNVATATTEDGTTLTIEYPATRSDRITLGRGRIRCDILGDGVSKVFNFPKL
jgi:hypothetical protein